MKKLFLSVVMTIMLFAGASGQYPYAYDGYPSYERYLVEFYGYYPDTYRGVYYTYYFYEPYYWNYGWNHGWYSWYYPYATPYWNYYGYGAYRPYWGGHYNYWCYSGHYSGWGDEWHGFHGDGFYGNSYYGPRTDRVNSSGPMPSDGSQTGSSGASGQPDRQNVQPVNQTPVNATKRDENAKPVQTYTYPRPQNGNSPNSYNYNYVRPSGGSTGGNTQTRPSNTQRPASGSSRGTAPQRPSNVSSGGNVRR